MIANYLKSSFLILIFHQKEFEENIIIPGPWLDGLNMYVSELDIHSEIVKKLLK